MVRLRHVDCQGPGFRRRRFGRGFGYVDSDGRRLTDPDVLARIAALVIPPAWEDVWICPLANGHLQATGLDAKSRRVEKGTITFDFEAKGGKRRIQSLVDDDLYAVMLELKARRGRGPELLAYRQSSGRRSRWVDVRSDEIYLRDATGIDCSAKDFRTWNASVLAAVALAVGINAVSPTARRRCVTRAMAEVAHYLGNSHLSAHSGRSLGPWPPPDRHQP